MRIACPALAVAFVLLLAPAYAQARTEVYYVDRASVGGHCSDAHTPSQARKRSRPWCSLRRAALAVPGRGAVRVRRGTYSDVTISGARRTARASFAPYRRERVVLRGLQLSDAHHVSFSGFEVAGAARRVTIEGGSSHVELARNRLHDLRTGFLLRDGGAAVVIRGNRLRNMIWARLNQKDGFGIVTVSGGWPGLKLVGNRIERTNGDGMQLGGMSRGVVKGNVVRGATSRGGNPDHADGIQVSGSMTRTLIAGNRVSRSDKGVIVGSTVPRDRSGIVFENNVFHDIGGFCMEIADVSKLTVRHNTCWRTGYGARLSDEVLSPTTHTTGARLYNNLFGPATRGGLSLDLGLVRRFANWGGEDHNLIGEAYGKLPWAGSDIVSPGAATLRRLLVAPSRGDFRPGAKSALVDAGTKRSGDPRRDLLGHRRKVGKAPDVGAVERQ